VALRWCCDVNPAPLERVRGQFPHVATTERLDDLVCDMELDAVVVATAAPTHYDVARKALLAGKHVLVEKPMTLTADDARDLTDLARRQERVLMVGHLLEYHPAVRRLRQIIDAGELGEVSYLVSQRLNLGTIRADENAWWSLAPHDLSVANRLFGAAPVSVQCRGQAIVTPGVDDVVFATLEYPGGRLAHFHVSWLDPRKSRTLTVVGTRKMAVFDDTAARKLIVHDQGVNHADGAVTLRQGGIDVPVLDAAQPLECEAQHFIECVRTGRRPLSDGASGARVVSVLEHGQLSLARGGKMVAISHGEASLSRIAG
jgi:predicted dehydrogenase